MGGGGWSLARGEVLFSSRHRQRECLPAECRGTPFTAYPCHRAQRMRSDPVVVHAVLRKVQRASQTLHVVFHNNIKKDQEEMKST